MTLETKLGELPMANDWKFLLASTPDRVYSNPDASPISRNDAVNTTRPAHPSSVREGHCLYSLPMSISFKAGPSSYGQIREQSDL